MEGFDQNLLLLFAVAAIAFYVGRMSTGSVADRERYKAFDRDLAQQNLSRLSSETRSDVERLIGEGQIIEAVKACRAELNIGLREAKLMVDALKAARS